MRSPRLVLVLLSALVLCGCQTTHSDSSGAPDYRQDQASRQTERDASEADKKVKRPLVDSRQDRQNVIDQPR